MVEDRQQQWPTTPPETAFMITGMGVHDPLEYALGIRAALDALDERRAEDAERRLNIELALQHSRFEVAQVASARPRYDAAAPPTIVWLPPV